MDIQRTEGVGGTRRIERRRVTPAARPEKSVPARPADKVEISSTARLLGELSKVPEVRVQKVQRLRELIQSGKYDTEERLEAAIERFLRMEGIID
jgi:anti-sigma28 factor (negative regulator of flagellin synthesis)